MGAKMMANHDWTPENIADLRVHWSSGLSTAEIGRRMGISKNAVVGKAHRMRLPAREAPANIAKQRSRAVVARPAARARQELPCSVQRAASPSGVSPAVERQASSRPERNLPGAGADVAPRRVFSDKTCQFLHGETRGEYRFCEAPVVARDNGAASPFCAEHYALCLISHKKAEAARKAQREADTAAGRMRWQAPSAWR
jgi:GcrA cell cycle regulator